MVTTETSERAVLAILMHVPKHGEEVFARLPPNSFTGPHYLLAEAIYALGSAGQVVDPSTVTVEMRRRGTLGRVGNAFAHEVAMEYIADTSLDYHMDVLLNEQRVRNLVRVGLRLANLDGRADVEALSVAREHLAEIQTIIDKAESGENVDVESLRELLSGEDPPFDWVIPGLLERTERLVLTGSEGLGKSVAMRQLAIATASGVHPFTHERMAPQRVLIVDVENSRNQVRRSVRSMVHVASRLGDDPRDGVFIECRLDGLDLSDPVDQSWLMAVAMKVQPSVLFTGPVYKMSSGEENDAATARDIAMTMDRVRAAANCAIVLEAHSPHAAPGTVARTVRPIGSSLWLRWPEFGYGLRQAEGYTPENRVVDFVSWRGDREARSWPKQLRSGGDWPWKESVFDSGAGMPPAIGLPPDQVWRHGA